jgi:glycosyltransferase involved in cell wall biosynthesis
MNRFWKGFIKPILDIIRPSAIVEIGSASGENTRNLAMYCSAHDATIFAIDPEPKFDPDDLKRRYGIHFVFYKELSLVALPKIPSHDVVLIDGDHNWYTVFNELLLIEKTAEKTGQFPVVLLHDIGWPYGRRDLYYNPATIPDAYRKPYEQKGIAPGRNNPVEKGGVNSHLYNAAYEHGGRNGVLTAVEDFLKQTKFNLRLTEIPGLNGLGILVPASRLEQKKEFVQFIRSLNMGPLILHHLQHVERERIKTVLEKIDTDVVLDELKKGTEQESEELWLDKRKMRLKNEEIARLKAIEDSASWILIKRTLDFFDNRLFPLDTRRSRIFWSFITWFTSLVFFRRKDNLPCSEVRQRPLLFDNIEHYGAKGDQKNTKMRKISFLTTRLDEQSKRYRVYNLIEELTGRGIECLVFQETDVNRPDLFSDSDLIVIFRVPDSGAVDFIIHQGRERNIPVIFDIDDLIFDPVCLQFFDGLNHMSLHPQQLFKDGVSRLRSTLLKSDFVTCSTDTIANYARMAGKNAFVIKNTINHEQFNLSNALMADKRYNAGGDVKIGYLSGTPTHNKDFMEASDAVYEMLRDYPSVEFHVVGHLNLEKKFSVFGQRVVVQPLMPYPDYLEYQSLLDINLAPLELNNPFADAKSELKIFEAALVGVPTVASPVAAYKSCITEGIDGLLAGTKEEWYEKLSLLVKDSSLRQRISETARKSFLERYYNKHVIDDVIRIYEVILDRYSAANPKS